MVRVYFEGGRQFDAVPRDEKLDSLDSKLIEQFFKRINERGRVELKDDWITNLKKLKLIRDEKITFAAHLLFGNPDTSIRIGRFKSEATIIDDIVLSGPLYSMVDEAMTHIKKHINLSYHFDGSIQRKERWQYPLEVIRELLLNSIVNIGTIGPVLIQQSKFSRTESSVLILDLFRKVSVLKKFYPEKVHPIQEINKSHRFLKRLELLRNMDQALSGSSRPCSRLGLRSRSLN